MIFKKAKQKQTAARQGKAELEITKGSSVEKQIRMIGLTEDDLRMINFLQPFAAEKLDFIVDRFYQNLEHEPSLLNTINHHSSIERLKNTLKRHISEMFDGVINDAYFLKRIKIAQIHVKIGLQTKWYMCAFQDLFLSLSSIIEENIEDKEEGFQALKAVSKMLNLEQQLVLEAYDSETERLKNEVEEQKNLIRGNVANASQNLAAISQETNASFHHLNAQSDEIVSLANTGTELSNLAEERAQKGKEQLQKQNLNMSDIHDSVNDISNDLQVLLKISKQMQEIVSIVTGIADQTNLLSLNAAIEAARAGEHGKGFSIVAEEVRKLSDETKKSVTNVAGLILNTNSQAEKLTSSLEKIREAVKEGNSSMKETGEHFEQILKTMGETKLQNNRIEQELISFTGVITSLGKAFDQVASSADGLTSITREME
ncbi:protoglobin domain-containing protein [Peribacillus sp. B-H-3]|jgi:heam-based aerotactic trancducer|uniref:protoglobin domain-containing protein n=1 Tax=Peribacillus sp. B-H-3 TaxID=3400420 RepID=UPI003B0121B6